MVDACILWSISLHEDHKLNTDLEVEDDSPAETQHYTRFTVHHIRGVDVDEFYFPSIENF